LPPLDPYASHLPTLRAVLRTYSPKRVLELGTGPHSTSLFIEAGVTLTSLETSGAWHEKAQGYGEFDLRLVDDVATCLPSLTDYDLVFVDDSDNLADRERSIRAVLSQPHPLTVIHDAEVPEYRTAIRELGNGIFVCTHAPHTAIVYPEGFDRRYEALLQAIQEET
jgi:predicted O-methyltransferase YrrM